jgi:hypothetical protein
MAPVIALLVMMAVAAPPPAFSQSNPYTSLTLTWTAPGDDGNTGQVSAYQISYRTTPVGPDTTGWWNGTPNSQRLILLPPLRPAGQIDSTLVTGLTQGTTYYFVIVALDEAQNASGYSNVAAGTTLSCGAPTSTVDAFAAAADTGQVVVSWTPTSDPAALSLSLYRATGTTGAFALLRSLPPGSSSFVDTSVQPSTIYRYRAAWAGPYVAGMACEGPGSAVLQVTTPGLPGAGSAAQATAASVHAFPNPSSGPVNVSMTINSTGPQSVFLRLFDMSGRWLATIADGNFPPGSTVVTWDRTGRNGQRVAPGYYEILGTIGGLRVRDRLVLVP